MTQRNTPLPTIQRARHGDAAIARADGNGLASATPVTAITSITTTDTRQPGCDRA